jgi:hypothetical protein
VCNEEEDQGVVHVLVVSCDRAWTKFEEGKVYFSKRCPKRGGRLTDQRGQTISLFEMTWTNPLGLESFVRSVHRDLGAGSGEGAPCPLRRFQVVQAARNR